MMILELASLFLALALVAGAIYVVKMYLEL
ncbi:MAG: hypothetical protein A4E45_00714 [Methanosaeta sp. PtaB.Bin039]|nr:MAG: hypothetical protein A4E45_00714 [Methanosaeta sp. PtaB.Bin039]OPY46168.1 MAG: hypothetical protein A4E47_00689 [Methanosaeta sp. PtaU1.Bin028]